MFVFNYLYFVSQDEYLEIKKFIDNNMDVVESALAPMNDYFDSREKCYGHYYCTFYYYQNAKSPPPLPKICYTYPAMMKLATLMP